MDFNPHETFLQAFADLTSVGCLDAEAFTRAQNALVKEIRRDPRHRGMLANPDAIGWTDRLRGPWRILLDVEKGAVEYPFGVILTSAAAFLGPVEVVATVLKVASACHCPGCVGRYGLIRR